MVTRGFQRGHNTLPNSSVSSSRGAVRGATSDLFGWIWDQGNCVKLSQMQAGKNEH